MHTIKDLWNGNIAPCEHCGSHNPEIKFNGTKPGASKQGIDRGPDAWMAGRLQSGERRLQTVSFHATMSLKGA